MNQSEISSFIWGIADLIRDVFNRGKYHDVIRRLTVLCRIDQVSVPTKERVFVENVRLKDKGLEIPGPPLQKVGERKGKTRLIAGARFVRETQNRGGINTVLFTLTPQVISISICP